MKIKHIAMAAVAMAALSSCNDYLDVDAPSAYDSQYIFSDKTEINKALTGIYASLLTNDSYGDAYMTKLTLNSDVDMNINSGDMAGTNNCRRFDCTSMSGDANKLWNALYGTIDLCNEFIYSAENCAYFKDKDTEVMQMYGEAKVIRSMAYHDLITYFGDVPFSLLPTSVSGIGVMPVKDRTEAYTELINDLKDTEQYLGYAASTTVERANREFCQAMIARMALAAGGYSLRPNKANPKNHGTMQRPANYKEFYQTARYYAKKVIDEGKHSLSLSYRKVFIDECNNVLNNSDDPIFEIPFTQNENGNVGYAQGPKSSLYENFSLGNNIWGECNGGARISRFYPYMFDEGDARRDYIVGMWGYESNPVTFDGSTQNICYPNFLNDYTWYNNKWSKLWATSSMGANSTGGTGINFPYMRYADVLLMFAEADNEINEGPTDEARKAVKAVRARAFEGQPAQIAKYDVVGDKEGFLKAVLKERALEFAGENMRWKDLVRNNLYADNIYHDFMRYYAVAEEAGGSSDFTDLIQEYDECPGYIENLPFKTYYYGGKPDGNKITLHENPKNIDVYPNTTLYVINMINPYVKMSADSRPSDCQSADCFDWYSDEGYPKNQVLYSFFGYVRSDKGVIKMVGNDGEPMPFSSTLTRDQLPVVRYLLPYPNAAVQRSAGQYKNYYGYTN